MRHVDILVGRFEIVVITVTGCRHTLLERLILPVSMHLDEVIEVIRLRDHTEVEERIETDEEMLASDIEIHYAEAEFHVRKEETVRQNAVRHHSADGVTATQSFVIDTLDEKRVHVVIHIEGRTTGDVVLRANAVSEGDSVDAVLVGIARHVVAEGEVELQVVITGCCLLTVRCVERR